MRLTKEEISTIADFIKSNIHRELYNNVVQFTYERMAEECDSTINHADVLKVIKELKTLL